MQPELREALHRFEPAIRATKFHKRPAWLRLSNSLIPIEIDRGASEVGAEGIWSRTGHSAKVGAAQDLLALNMDLPSVMQAGRWRDTRMPMRYGEKVLAGRGAMARAAKAQGRA